MVICQVIFKKMNKNNFDAAKAKIIVEVNWLFYYFLY